MCNVIDEFTRESLAIKVARKLTSKDVTDTLAELFLARGVPEHVRSDNGPEFIATNLRAWFTKLELKPLFIKPGSPWENGVSWKNLPLGRMRFGSSKNMD